MASVITLTTLRRKYISASPGCHKPTLRHCSEQFIFATRDREFTLGERERPLHFNSKNISVTFPRILSVYL